jgi:hypothetical protein
MNLPDKAIRAPNHKYILSSRLAMDIGLIFCMVLETRSLLFRGLDGAHRVPHPIGDCAEQRAVLYLKFSGAQLRHISILR